MHLEHSMASNNVSARGTAQFPNYYDGPADIRGDVHLSQRFFTYQIDGKWVGGKTFNVMFTIERRAKNVWPFLKDFNLWQNSYGHYFSGVMGDLEGKTFRIGDRPDDNGPHQFRVLRVIPESTMVVTHPPAQDDSMCGITTGFYVVMLNEHGGKSIITVLMQHDTRTAHVAEEAALHPWRKVAPESQRKWRDIFIPDLKTLVYAAS
jgi:hypothetical protein